MSDASTRRRVLVGSSALGRFPNARLPEPPAGTLVLDLGEDHPSRAGLLELAIWTGGDREDDLIERCQVKIGALHRGAEKLYEVRDYRQIMMLADRHDWHAPFVGELGVALLCEQQLGVEPPVRATWLRTLLAEQTRVASHLAFLSYLSARLPGCPSVAPLRERIRRSTAALTGNRVHPMISLVGGLGVDASADWLTETDAIAVETVRTAGALDVALDAALDAALAAEDQATVGPGLAPIGVDVVHAFGVSGPAARAAGVPSDLRRDQPYLAYADLAEQLAPPVVVSDDAAGRFALMIAEVRQSAGLVRACVERLRELDGPVAVKLGKIIRLPEGDGYLATEAPLGRSGFYVVSRGEKVPWRLKLRTASFNNVASWEQVLIGCPVARLETALASLGYVIGDLDK